jgi:selenocysteine-specific elongation factor
MHVIGTAGHVDHGKSTLVEALTGIDPDRLKEEKEREMTIDLGFAWIKNKDHQEEIGIVDVPGHRDFIENMLAGVGGIDLALLVIAADEGVMPQTREHLAILDLLEIRGGIVAVTKIDLVDDPDWLELVELEISETLSNTVLENAEIIPVSAVSGKNIDRLLESIWQQLSNIGEKPDKGQPRLPIDRIFSISGFGTIVTGTLIDGHLKLGDQIEVQPEGLRGRIRGLQTHQTKIEMARPGSRVAVNLSGIAKNDISRGSVLTHLGTLSPTLLCDAKYNHLIDTSFPLKHNTEVKFFVGADEIVARVRIIGDKQINPGQSGWIQLALRQPIAVARGDRFILRRPSPPATLGGGLILDPQPGRRHKRYSGQVAQKFSTLEAGSPEDILLLALQRNEPISIEKVYEISGLDAEVAENAWISLTADEKIALINDEAYSSDGWHSLATNLRSIVSSYHINHPLRIGISREELRSRLNLSGQHFNHLLNEIEDTGEILLSGNMVRLPEFEISFTEQQKQRLDQMSTLFLGRGVNSPSVKETKAMVGDDVYMALVDLNRLIQINQEVVYLTDTYRDLERTIVDYLNANGSINAGQTRDILGTSRKYAIALLEFMDSNLITERKGDDRLLKRDSRS